MSPVDKDLHHESSMTHVRVPPFHLGDGMAQVVERRICVPRLAASNPIAENSVLPFSMVPPVFFNHLCGEEGR